MQYFEKQHFRKLHKKYLKNKFQHFNNWQPKKLFVSFIKTKKNCVLSPKLLEICRQLLIREFRQSARISQIKIPIWPIMKKPAEMRMGKGKGKFLGYVSPCLLQDNLFTINGINCDSINFNKIKNKIYKKLP